MAYKANHPNDEETIVTDHLRSLQIQMCPGEGLGNSFVGLILVEQKKELDRRQSDIEHIMLVQLMKCGTWTVTVNVYVGSLWFLVWWMVTPDC